MVAGLNEITEGGVILDGNEISGAAPDRGVVFQSPCLLPWMSAWDNVMLGVKQVYYHASNHERKQIVEYYLTVVGLSGSFNKRPDELSGGMRQRVGLARAFALSPKMLLLDEPFSALDLGTRRKIATDTRDILRAKNTAAIHVTHDPEEAEIIADRVLLWTDITQSNE